MKEVEALASFASALEKVEAPCSSDLEKCGWEIIWKSESEIKKERSLENADVFGSVDGFGSADGFRSANTTAVVASVDVDADVIKSDADGQFTEPEVWAAI